MTTTVDATISEGAGGSTEPVQGLEEAFAEANAELEQPADQGANEAPEAVADAPPTFTWDVDGQERTVTEEEARNGYLRQRDYTQKTQDLAEQRQRLAAAEGLWKALQDDPAVALEALQDHYADLLNEDPPDPVEQRLREVESFTSAQQQAAIEAEIEAEIERLSTEYGDPIDRDELLEFAIDNEIPNLEAAYTYRKTLSEREAKRVAAKQSAPPIETRGSNQANTSAAIEEPIGSVEEAVRAAMKELGVESLATLA